ncbi:hypothetical protein QO058_30625 (plasmid) [Bosea vestrisii]|uniref:hypothetical protein n=1 Tax=Bosea vestrisii TaxID=151416 RepID=UPI0024DF998C|nr:hypothetical protein [Bosea vestrisii]WID99750.1 hypothetical protein QO058_30625 [Bosea vestrisii]
MTATRITKMAATTPTPRLWRACRCPFAALRAVPIATVLVWQGLHLEVNAQQRTPDPGAWRPISYSDLTKPSLATATFADIWKDEIEANNKAYREAGDFRFASGNAPATEAHFVIWSPTKSVVLSILNAATRCTSKQAEAGVRVKLCPMRLIIYEGIRVRVLDADRGCFLELDGAVGQIIPSATAYAAYDVTSRTVKTGLVAKGRAVDGCSHGIPIPP